MLLIQSKTLSYGTPVCHNKVLVPVKVMPILLCRCVGYRYLPYSPDGAKVEQVSAWTTQGGLLLGRNVTPFTEKFVKYVS